MLLGVHKAGWCALAGVLAIALMCLHLYRPLNTDSAWLLYLAQQIDGGRQLYSNIFETNPPLIVWINQLAVKLASLLGVSPQAGLVIQTGLLSALSCYWIWRHVPASALLRLSAIGVLVFLLPANFAQREYYLMILAMPYLLSFVAGKAPTHLPIAFCAAIGFCIKPYFVVILFAMWLVYALQARNLRWLLTPAQLVVVAVGASYLGYLLFVDRLYIDTMVPLLMQVYGAFNAPMSHVLTEGGALFVLFQLPVVLALFDRQATLDKPVIWRLQAWMLAAFAVVLLQHKGWANHWYLVCICGVILNSMLLFAYARQRERLMRKAVFALSVAACAGVGVMSIMQYDQKWRYKDPTGIGEKLSLLETKGGHSVAALTFNLPTAFPLAQYAGMNWVLAHGHLWYLPGFYSAIERCEKDGIVSFHALDAMPAAEKAFFEDSMARLLAQKPHWILIGEGKFCHPCGEIMQFNLLDYYLQDARFAALWKDYTFIEEVNGDRFYRRNE